MKYRIYPSIGIARVGNSPSAFYVGPERMDSPGVEIAADGAETSIVDYKSPDRATKRQAARFRLYQFDDNGGNAAPVVLPAGSRIEWSVRIVNKKDAVVRREDPPAPPGLGESIRPEIEAGMENRIIDSGVRSIAGANTGSVGLSGTYRGHPVELGELRTDRQQRLIVLGGKGQAGSPTLPGLPNGAPIGREPGGGGYYNNRGWYDDVGDGPVTARIVFGDGTVADATPAWVVVAPPDFAPAVGGVVTLRDIMIEVALANHWMTLSRPNFWTDIRPMLMRANALQWVNQALNWATIKTNGTAIETPDMSAAARQQREATRIAVLKIETALSHNDAPHAKHRMRQWQKDYLQRWVDGDFDTTVPAPTLEPSPLELTRAALDGTVGQTFFPGIEAGVITLDPRIYVTPFDFRVSHTAVLPGDLTALMALPWQADFLKCGSEWWPAQRPNVVLLESGEPDAWDRPSFEHRDFVSGVMKLGVVQQAVDAAGNPVMIEVGRDPTLDP